MRSVVLRVCRLQVLRTRALAPRRQGYNYDYCGSALAPRRQGYNNDKYCALARLPPDGRAAPRRQSYNYEYCALARLPPDDRATIKTNNAHARMPPDDRAAPRRPGLLHCTHAKGSCIRVSYHQIYGGTRCKLKGGTSHEREPRHKDVWEMLGGTLIQLAAASSWKPRLHASLESPTCVDAVVALRRVWTIHTRQPDDEDAEFLQKLANRVQATGADMSPWG